MYSANSPVAPVRVRAEVNKSTSSTPEIDKLVEVAFVEVELANVCHPVQVFALARFKFEVIVPDVVTGVEPIVSVPELERPTEVTVPTLEARQVPLTAKHPVVMFQPTSEVEVAEPVIVSPERVVVPKPVPETVRYFVASEEEATSNTGLVCTSVACTDSFA